MTPDQIEGLKPTFALLIPFLVMVWWLYKTSDMKMVVRK